MKKIVWLIFALLLSSTAVFSQKSKLAGGKYDFTWGVGVHLGDPVALSAKKYLGKSAFELTLGYSNWGILAPTGAQYFAHKNYNYNAWSAPISSGDFVTQFHYMMHHDLPLEGLRLMWGLGPQLRYRVWGYNWILTNSTYVDIDFGIDGLVGAEYKFRNLPFVIYANIVPFVEIVDRPSFRPCGGIGGRFVF